MKREIKFRGQRLDNKEWVYGGYFQNTEDEYVINYIFTFENGAIPVDKNTICQFIGLKDLNNKDIYDNDIIKNVRCFENSFGEIIETNNIKVIKYNSDNCSYDFAFMHIPSIEIIGNTFENHELIS